MRIGLLVILSLSLVLMAGRRPDKEARYHAIYSGISWFDQNQKEVNAHGACIVKEGDQFYLFGEWHTDTSNAFAGFSCYSSSDLMNWKFEKIVLPTQTDGLLGPNRVGERVKVMKCPATGEFVMYMHTDDLKYSDPHVGYATCKTIDGDYQFQGELLHEGKYLRRWDLGTFQDQDGKGYLLTHEGNIYELATDYKSVKRMVVSGKAPGGESPAMFKSNGTYFWMFSNKTSWERNDNYYLTASSLEGPWVKKGYFAPEGTLTWNSQCSFVLPIPRGKDTLYLYMGDRWSYPKQGSAATYVWQPITLNGREMAIPEFQQAWCLTAETGLWKPVQEKNRSIRNKYVVKEGNWTIAPDRQSSKEKGAILSFPMKGRRIGIEALSGPMSGYARVTIRDNKNEKIIRTIVDFYSLYEYSSLKFLSPELEYGDYVLSIEVLGEHPKWSDKRRSDYGSKGDEVNITDVFTIK